MSAIPYKRAEISDTWDTIVIGSGLSGLTLASLLARRYGERVLVLERHYVAGGFTHTFKRPGYEWDVGVHYVGDMHEGAVLRTMFDAISDGSLKWADMGEVYDTILIGERKYEFVKGRENFRARMKEYFPEESEAIDQYIDLIRQSARTSADFFGAKALPKLPAKLLAKKMQKPGLDFASKSVREVLENLTQNQELIAVLTGQFGDYGLPPAEASFLMHSTLVKHYWAGGYYPEGGSSTIAESIIPVIEAAGGQVLINAEVAELVVEGNKATGVRMAKDDRILRAKNIISSAGVRTTITKILPQETVQKHKLIETLDTVEPTPGHLCLYIGLNKTAEELNLPKSNYWVYPNADHEGNCQMLLKDEFDESDDLPIIYISFPGAKDPSYATNHPGHSAIDIITVAPYEWFQKWEGSRWKKRGEEYEAFKQKFVDKILKKLFELFPQVEDAIDIAELSTPLTTQHFCNYQLGEVYGIEHKPDRFSQDWLKPATPIKNFWLTGQDIVTVGVGGALFSGVLTASAMKKRNIVMDIVKDAKAAR